LFYIEINDLNYFELIVNAINAITELHEIYLTRMIFNQLKFVVQCH